MGQGDGAPEVIVAMDAQIHGALVGGALGGAVVLVGIALTEWLERVRSRRAAIGAAVRQVTLRLPYVTAPISELWRDDDRPIDGSRRDEWIREREAVDGWLREIELEARWPLRRAKEIRSAARDLQARLAAASFNWTAERALLSEQAFYDSTGLSLNRAAFPKTGPVMDDEILRYRETLRAG